MIRYTNYTTALFLLVFFILFTCPTAYAQVGIPEICNNGIDDDGDGLIDCFDTDCSCAPGQCDNFYYNTCPSDCFYLAPCDTVDLSVQWTGNVSTGSYPVMVAGDMDNDGVPDIVTYLNEGNLIYIIDGATGNVKVTITSPTVLPGGTSPAIADLDHDGFGELVIVGNDRRLRCYEHTGTLKYTSAIMVGYDIRYRFSSPNIADFDHNGWAEINIGNQVFNGQTGALLAQGNANMSAGEHPSRRAIGFSFNSTVPMDVLPDAFCADCQGLEIVAGNQVLSVNLVTGVVAVRVSAPLLYRDGFTSVADFDGDGDLDAIVQGKKVNQNTVYVWEIETSTVIREFALFNNYVEGASRVNVADLNGDGDLEVNFISYPTNYTLNNDFTVLWTRPTADVSAVTCSSVFDFCGDGSADVVYRDQSKLQVIEGATGTTKWETDCTSATHIENPLILDVDADGNTEVVTTCGNYGGFTDGTVVVFESLNTPGISSRQVWNQHTYFNTNINDDLSVPRYQQNPNLVGDGLKMNTFLNQYFNPIFPAGDGIININAVTCNGDSLYGQATICNQGVITLPATMPISFYSGSPLANGAMWLGSTTLGQNLAKDSCRTISFVIPRVVNQLLTAVFNDNHSVPTPYSFMDDFPVTGIGECHFENNMDSFTFAYNPVLPSIGNDTAICAGQSFTLDASGGDIVSWNWQNGTSTDTTFLVTDAGVFSVATTDICNILTQESITVSIENNTSIQLGSNTAICIGESLTFTQNNFDNYEWSPANIVSCTDCPSVTVSPTQSAWLFLHAYLDNGCQARDSILIVVNDTTYQLLDTTVCKGSTLLYNGMSLSAGQTEVFYLSALQTGCDSTILLSVASRDTFFTSATQLICSGETADVFGIPTNVSGYYSKVFVAQNGCDSTHNIALTVASPINVQLGTNTELCEGESLVQTQSGADNYNWSPTNIVNCVDCPSVTVAPTQTAWLFLDASMDNGCSVRDSVLITVHDTTYQLIENTICNGSTVLWDGQTILPGEQRLFSYQTIHGCDSTILVRVIGTQVGTYQLQLDTSLCKGNSMTYNGMTLSAGQTEVFYLSTLQMGCDSTVTVNIAARDTFFTTSSLQICGGETADIFGDSIGISGYYSKIYVAANGCDSTHNITLTVDPTINIQLVAEATCLGFADGFIQSNITGGQPPYSYQWTGGITSANPSQLLPGSYTLTLTDQEGCSRQSVVTVTTHPSMQYSFSTDSVRCFGQKNGIIEINYGNDTTLLFNFEDKGFSAQRIFKQLAAGTYTVQVQDINGCTEAVNVNVWQPEELQVQLPSDTTIQLGDSLLLQSLTNSQDPNLQYSWYPPLYLRCDTCAVAWSYPFKSIQYTLKVENINGCKAQDIMKLLVQRKINIFVPNVFLPEQAQQTENTILLPFFGTAVKQVEHFRIFDRWGELVHQREKLMPDDLSLAWDGNWLNRVLPSGVYVWSLEVELADGTKEMYKGDVTLVR